MICCKMEENCFSSDVSNFTTKYSDVSNDGNQTIVDFDEVWMRRLREVQGAIISASLVELAVGLSGLVGIFLQLISPLAIAPVIALIGLSLFQAAVDMAGQNWTISGRGISGSNLDVLSRIETLDGIFGYLDRFVYP